MAQLHNPKNNYSKALIAVGLTLLMSALFFGLMGATEYAFPGLWRDVFPFTKIRPLHVSSAVFWILIAALGSVLTFLKEHNEEDLKHQHLIKWIFYLFTGAIIAILISYFFGIFIGREYWEFHPVFAIPISIGWILFITVFLSNFKTLKNQPVYVWMWFTGALFFLFTYLESNLWLIPGFRNQLAKDMTIQWKSYGSMVGAWNMLIYGSSIYLMDKIAGNKKYSYSNIAFFLFFLSLFNLMFNWGHHIYTLPTADYVKHIAYIVSMTELFIFGRMIYLWKSSVTTARKHFHSTSYRFLLLADVWVFLTLGLAIVMSIPAFNLYMHGTHVIVGHTMGATIGINSMLLLAFIFDILRPEQTNKNNKQIRRGFWITQVSLLIFWMTLIVAGFIKSKWQFTQTNEIYGSMIYSLKPLFHIFLCSGIFLILGLVILSIPLFKKAFTVEKINP